LNNEIEAYWRSFLKSMPKGSELPTVYQSWHFCDNEKDANELAELVLAGTKTATCSLVWGYEAENENLPEVGDFSVITNWEGTPQCIIETIEVRIKPFNEVDDSLAFDEGEGDRSLAYWRNVHWDCFTRECSTIGRKPTKTMPLLCERFQLVFPKLLMNKSV